MTTEEKIDIALEYIRTEVIRAMTKHPKSFNSHHEGYAVLLEEIDELWDAVKTNNHGLAHEEIIQCGAMCVRYFADVCMTPK